jgi:hypothetical protein
MVVQPKQDIYHYRTVEQNVDVYQYPELDSNPELQNRLDSLGVMLYQPLVLSVPDSELLFFMLSGGKSKIQLGDHRNSTLQTVLRRERLADILIQRP